MKTVYSEIDMQELDEDEDQPVYCKKCLSRGYRVALGPKILMPGEVRQPDYDEWLECPTCSLVIAKYEIEKEASIKDTVETLETPFENQTEVVGIPKRSSPSGKKASSKRKRERNRQHLKDPEIDREMQRHGDGVNVVYDSD
jgi:hypothetical protein